MAESKGGQNRFGGGEETGGRDNDNIGAGLGGGGGRGIERGLGRRKRIISKLAVQVERNGAEQMIDQPRQTTGRKHVR